MKSLIKMSDLVITVIGASADMAVTIFGAADTDIYLLTRPK